MSVSLKIKSSIRDPNGSWNLRKILKLTEVNDNTIKNAELIVNNNFVLQESLDTLPFKDKIDWDYKHFVSPNTYQLYLHSLMPISYLCNAYELTNDVTYLDKSLKILLEWLDFESKNTDNQFVWYDHSSAYRTHNLLYLYLLIDSNFDSTELSTMILKHVEYLYSDTYYRKNNHGIMMDRALIQVGVIFENPEATNWVNKGVFRLKDNFHSSYSSKGIHLENSPEYHHVVQKLFLSIEDFLNKHNLSLGEDIIDRFEQIQDYYSYIVKPNGFLPMIGDSSNKKISGIYKKFESFIDFDAGICVLQSENKKEPNKSTWLSFVCGYSTLTHKHIDDLSVTLFYNGDDILVDSGKHSYGSSPARAYVRSARAHNTIVVNDRNYKLPTPKEAKDKIIITDFTTNMLYDFVKGRNLAYDGTSIERSLLFIKPDVCIILDRAKSNKIQKYSQIFTLSPNTSIKDSKSTHTTINTPNSQITIQQLNNINKLVVHHGDISKPNAVISEKFSKLTNTIQLEYISRGEEVYFLTLIRMGGNNSRVSDIKYDSQTNILELSIDNKFISLVI